MEKKLFFAIFGGHLEFLRKTKNVNISETVRDRAISTEFFTHRVVEKYPMSNGKKFFFAIFGGHLEFLRKTKNVNIPETVRDRAISTEFWTHRVVEKYAMRNGKKKLFFAIFGGHLEFLRNMKIVNISETVRDRAISTEFFTHRVVEKYPMRNGKKIIFRHFWRPS